MQWALDNLKPVKTVWDEMQLEKTALEAKISTAETVLEGAINACKVAAFERAQEAREKAIEVAAAVADKVAEVKLQYTDQSAFPSDGSVGSLCNFGKPDSDGISTDRVPCAEGAEGAPLCCGAAQTFLKDGTKLTIETCQLASATTYKYFPALPNDAIVAPTPETWRFQCISAAQKLAAAATAALAAGYMMA
jgi:hypothetical protein